MLFNLFMHLQATHLVAPATIELGRYFSMTAAKLAANRANAQHSTGPANSSRTRFNGLQHGLTSKQIVIPGETQEEFDNFRASFLSDLKPQSALEQTLADRLIVAAWRLKRFQRMEGAFYANRVDDFLEKHPEADPNIAMANLFIDPVEIAKLRLFLRYQTTVQREFDKAMSEYGKIRAEREKQLVEEALTYSAAPTSVPEVGFASQTEPRHLKAQSATASQSRYDGCSSANLSLVP
jgi:hypothetical protein